MAAEKTRICSRRRNPMLRQYDLLNKCLKELKGSMLPAEKRLRVELLLIQTKRVLLKDEVESKVTGDVASEKEFLGVYEHLRRVCGCYSKTETEQFIVNLGKTKEDLDDISETKRESMGCGQERRYHGRLTATRTA
jgi:hypothetical protein